ncbi:MAG: NAD(P)/FAD-dependent oxidoreductase [Nanoarchaeota archaeon]|nr:NAD(P)/FAD-dependent oxidoreductase [Nanoarchaeota archaeon]
MIHIVGAGPAGNYTAYQLARQQQAVTVHEEHNVIGNPIQCTGILTGNLTELLPIQKKYLVNTIKRVAVYSNHEEAHFKLQQKNYVVNRTLFDNHIATLAKKAGANYQTNSKYTGCTLEKKKIICDFSNGQQEANILIGADGPHSAVARSVNIYGKRRFYHGLQATVKKKFEKDLVEFYIGKHYIAWVVPENEELARIGVSSETIAGETYKWLLKKIGGKIVARQAGPIPIYEQGIQTSYQNRIFLVGDAAAQVKASTHGGIIPGMLAGQALAEAIVTKKNYETLWKKKLAKDLLIHALIKKMMDKFDDKNFDYLLQLMNKPNVQHLIETYDREFPKQYAMKLIKTEPRFLSFLTKLL